MELRGNKKFFQDLLYSKFAVVLGLFVLIFIFFMLAKGTIKTYKVNAQVKQLQGEISRLDKQNGDFEQLVKYLNTDTFIEQEAKLKLGLKKENENLVIIPDSAINPKTGTNASAVTESNPGKWWAYFFD